MSDQLQASQHAAPTAQSQTADCFADVYEQLRSIAGKLVGTHAPQLSLQATALVHELWLNLSRHSPDMPVEDSRQFLIAAATSMRRILIDHYRTRNAGKRGGGWQRVPLRESRLLQESGDAGIDELEALDAALDELRVRSARQAQCVELRFFAGLTMPQIAHVLGVSLATAERDWRVAKARLFRALARAAE